MLRSGKVKQEKQSLLQIDVEADDQLWLKVKIQKGIDYWHLFKVFCTVVLVYLGYSVVYKGLNLSFLFDAYELKKISFSSPLVRADFGVSDADIIEKTKTILCIVGFTKHDSQELIKIAEKYLSRSCGGLMFVTDAQDYDYKFKQKVQLVVAPDKNLQFFDQRRYLTYHGLAAASHQLKKYEWFLRIAAPSVLVYPENFARFVLRENMKSQFGRYFVGHTLTKDGHQFNYALSAYGLHRSALKALAPTIQQIVDDKVPKEEILKCFNREFHTEDDFPGFCMKKDFKITPSVSRDNFGKEYFLTFQIRDHYEKMNNWVEDWYWQNKDPKNVGKQCCAQFPVAFTNYKKTKQLEKLYESVYGDEENYLSNMFIQHLNQLHGSS